MKKRLWIVPAFTLLLVACSSDDITIEQHELPEELKSEEEVEEVEEAERLTASEENKEKEIENDNPSENSVVHRETFEREGGEVEIEVAVHPIEIEGELALLTVDFQKISGNERINLEDMIHHPPSYRTHSLNRGNPFERLGYQMRLLDPVQYTVSHTLFFQDYKEDHQGEQYLATNAITGERIDERAFKEGEVVTYSAIFNAPVEDTVHVLIESFDLISSVPVIESENVRKQAQEFLEGNITEDLAISLDDLEKQVYPLQTYHESIELPVGTLVEEEQATITLDSDVLFAIDSSELQSESHEILEAAAKELSRVDSGELFIVGHTDNNGTDEYNQTLSEERAKSVRDHLAEIVDLTSFESVKIEGRSFHEPIVSNDSEEGQALNRRVEFLFTPPANLVEIVEEKTEIPDSLGAVMEYETGKMLEVEYLDRYPYGISIDSLTRLDGFIIGRLRIHNTDDNTAYIPHLMNSGLGHGGRGFHVGEDVLTSGGMLDHNDANGVTLLYGDQRIFPIDYWALTVNDRQELGQKELAPLVSRNVKLGVGNNLDLDDSIVVTVIWPDVPADVITLDKAPTQNYQGNLHYSIGSLVPWRITDVPIQEYKE
ncbi:OmpA family protein [Alkalihalobacillus trypoxylicola]|uniref:OmpA-like domain-containing protein n=1 Tax=Alkalihalobacillus trypoxylicola TaxID=519424 RepID=A0A162FA80_9BACI|nr:OmpA family protein [Alkalihalobacillus trypoxylicola]KYG35139.1 hypothetical protein AZF04_02040 [Alkalihalobacillus trypoxylicola]